MPKWLQTLLALIGLGAKEFVSVKVGGTKPADAITEGTAAAIPVVEELIHEIKPPVPPASK